MFGMNDSYWLYMNEAEATGLVNTRQGRLNQIGRALRDMGYAGKVVPTGVFASLLIKYKMTDITQDEIAYLEREWI
jgi:hypothetical protein